MPFASLRDEEFPGISIDQLDFRELDGDDTDLLERDAKDVEVFPCKPPSDAENKPLFNRKSSAPKRSRRCGHTPPSDHCLLRYSQ